MTPDSSAQPTNPTLSDYARSVWRRKAIVAAGLVAGLALGIVVFPRILPSNPDYEARTRLDVRPLTLQTQGSGGKDNTASQPVGTAALTPDILAAQTVVDDLGPLAKRLRVLKAHDRSRWATKLAGAMRSSAINGTTQVQVSFADDDPALARTTLDAYVEAYAGRRNDIYDKQLSAILSTLNGDAKDLENQVLKWSNQADRERGLGGVSVVTSTELDLAKQRYAAKTAQIDDISRAAALNPNPTQVLDKVAVVPSDNAGNSGISLALGLLLGIMGGVGFAFLAEATAPKLVTPVDVQAATGLSVLATVPRLARRRRARGSGLVVVDRPFSPAAEGYRQVGTALERQGLGHDIKVLAIISADPGDGKSLLAANLAHSLARQGREVVLVSGDLRRPHLEKLLGLKQRAGLAEALRDDPIPAITMLLSIKECLLLLPAGMPSKHPGELLASRRLGEIIAELRMLGGIVILDTPPARLSADAITLAGVADAIVLVARSSVTRMRSLREATSGLRRDRIRQLGVVLVGTSSPILRSRHLSYYREQPEFETPEQVVQSRPPVQLSPRPAPRPAAGNGKGEQHPPEAGVTDLSAAADRPGRAME